MRVVEDARKCSVFLGYGATPEDFEPRGTGFFIHLPGFEQIYLVTAAHIARDLRGEPFAIRLNKLPRHGGGSDVMLVDYAEWFYHNDKTVDVAVLEITPPKWADATALPTSEFIDDYKMRAFEVGPGDTAFIVGLFSFFAGKLRNVPIVHSGNIAMLASDEKVPVRKRRGSAEIELAEVHLVESAAMPGASGSQVLVCPTIPFMAKDTRDKTDAAAQADGRHYLLGVWVANWPGDPDDIVAREMKLRRDTQVPVGIGMVAPARFIREILRHPTLERNRLMAEQKRSHEKLAIENGILRT